MYIIVCLFYITSVFLAYEMGKSNANKKNFEERQEALKTANQLRATLASDDTRQRLRDKIGR